MNFLPRISFSPNIWSDLLNFIDTSRYLDDCFSCNVDFNAEFELATWKIMVIG